MSESVALPSDSPRKPRQRQPGKMPPGAPTRRGCCLLRRMRLCVPRRQIYQPLGALGWPSEPQKTPQCPPLAAASNGGIGVLASCFYHWWSSMTSTTHLLRTSNLLTNSSVEGGCPRIVLGTVLSGSLARAQEPNLDPPLTIHHTGNTEPSNRDVCSE
jgi:hypothetical protein